MESNYIRFTALSGAKSEEPLCYLLEIDEARILLDCGWNDAFDVEDLKQLKRIAKDVDVCLLSHATLHHLGALAYAKAHLGLRANVYATIPVVNMGRLTMYDAWRAKRYVEDFNVFGKADIDAAFEHMERLRFKQPVSLIGKCKGIVITAHAAGHSVGGTVWKIKKESEVIVYAMDYNHKTELHLNGTALLPKNEEDAIEKPTLMITDAYTSPPSTTTRKNIDKALLDTIQTAFRNNGSVLIPTDSSTRILELAYLLDEKWRFGRNCHLIVLTNVIHNTARFANSMSEWMGDSFNGNPMTFRNVKACQKLSDLDKYVGPKVILASNLSLESGFARELFLTLAQEPKTVLILTERALPGELGRLLYDTWQETVGESAVEEDLLEDSEVAAAAQMNFCVRLRVNKKVPLEGQELIDFQASEQERLEREAADKALLEKNRLLLEQENNSDDDDDDDDADDSMVDGGVIRSGAAGGAHAEVDLLLTKSGTHDVYMKDATKSGGFFKQTQSYRMFPFVERRKKIDDYGESISVEHFLSASSGAHEPSIQLDANGEAIKMGDGDEFGNGMDGVEPTGGASENNEERIVLPEDTTPSKFIVVDQDVNVRCLIRFFDMEGHADEESMVTILGRLGPKKLILVHGTEEGTKTMAETCASLGDFTNEIFTPSVGQILNVSEVTNMYKINLTDALITSLQFSKLGDTELAYLVGKVQNPSGSANPVLGLPNVDAAVAAVAEMAGVQNMIGASGDMSVTSGVIVKSEGSTAGQDNQNSTALTVQGGGTSAKDQEQQQRQILQHQQQLRHVHQQQLEQLARKHQPVFVGDIKLAHFKDQVLMKQARILADFKGDGSLVCKDPRTGLEVSVRKVANSGQILFEGSPLHPDYYRIRDLLYGQFAIL